MKRGTAVIFLTAIPLFDKAIIIILELNEIDKNIYTFSLQQDKDVRFSVFLTTKTGSAVLKLSGRGSEKELISEYQIFNLRRGEDLKKGDYKLLLTSNGCDGEIYIFIKK